ncbi:MAG: hypothetical protein ACRD28_07020 [Acidobacteriaceae bacterium]
MRRLRFAVGAVFFLWMGLSAGAQAAPGNHAILSNGNLLHTLLAAPVLGQPYSAMVRHSSTRTLADGTTISHKGHHFIARDSEGRVRVEVRMARGSNGGPDTRMVFVRDPVAHTLTTWVVGPDTIKKIATTITIPDEGSRKVVRHRKAVNPGRPQPVVTTEDLGMDTLQGVSVSVARKTTVVPAGRVGNDAPITKTLETWTSPDLKLVMKQQYDDPRSGEKIVEMDQLSRAEPDPSLFHPPAGYVVKTAVESLRELEQKLSAAQN